MLWVGGAQGAGKSTLCWQLSRNHDLPLHPVDLWAYDHQARLPVGDTLDSPLARGAEAAADAFESVSRLRLGLVLDDIQSREERPAEAAALGGPPAAGRLRMRVLVERDAVIAERVRVSAGRTGRPVIEVPPQPDWPAIAAAVETALGPALRSAPRLAPGPDLSRQRRYENRQPAARADCGCGTPGSPRRPRTRSGVNAGRASAAQPGRPRPTTTPSGPLPNGR